MGGTQDTRVLTCLRLGGVSWGDPEKGSLFLSAFSWGNSVSTFSIYDKHDVAAL